MHPSSAAERLQDSLALLAVKGDQQAREALRRSIAAEVGPDGGQRAVNEVLALVLTLASARCARRPRR
jgi:hypothetical protein